MEHEQYESPRSDAIDPAQMDDVSLKGCPYLGLARDPQTTLAFASRANLCYRLRSPAGVELSHQREFCLSSDFANCYVYGEQTITVGDAAEAGKASLSLLAIKARLSSFREGILLPNVDISSLKVRMQSLNQIDLQDLKARLPSASALKNIDLQPAKSRLKSIDLNDIRFDRAAITTAISNWNISSASVKSRVLALDNRQLGLIVTPLVILVILLAAVIWWPQGEMDQDALALGSSAVEETAVVLDQTVTGDPVEGEDESGEAPALQPVPAPSLEDLSGVEAVDQPAMPDGESVDKIPAGSLVEDQLNSTAAADFVAPEAVGTSGQNEANSAVETVGAEPAAPQESGIAITVDEASASEQEELGDPEEQSAPQESSDGSSEADMPVAYGSSDSFDSAESSETAGEFAEAAAPDDESILAKGIVNAGALNIRSGPGLDHDPLGYVFNKQEVFLLELPSDENVWVKVRSADGLVGWLNSKYLLEISTES